MNNFIIAPYKSIDEIIVINLDQLVVAMPRNGQPVRPGEERGKVYTSFLLSHSLGVLGAPELLDTILLYRDFLDRIGFKSIGVV